MVASEDLEKFRVAGGSPRREGGSDAISSSNIEATFDIGGGKVPDVMMGYILWMGFHILEKIYS
jgi:hypothetical protein